MDIKLKSGFTFDFTNLYGDGKVTESDIKEFAEAAKKAHEAVQEMRKTGVIRGHLSKDGTPEMVYFSKLPYIQDGPLNSEASMKRLQDLADSVQNKVDAVISLGIGGSYLGNKVLFDVKCGEFWNTMTKQERNGFPKLYFSGNNIDPRRTGDLIKQIKRDAKIDGYHGKDYYNVTLICISKSGGTLDTMSNFMVIYDALTKEPNINVKVVAVTDPNEEKPTLLKKMAMDKDWPQYSVPDGVGGRFTVFCDVGLCTAAATGFDVEAFLKGAREMDEACQTNDVMQNPALLNSLLKHIASEKYGRDIEVMMPYGDYLKSLSEWYVQLLAESLGKKYDREGKVVNAGRTPIVAVGTTDMHAQTQQHQEGKLNKVVQFVKVENWDEDITIPNCFPEVGKLADIAGVTMGEALEVARESNAQALASDGRFSAVYSLPKLNEYYLGQLMYMLALGIAYEGELLNVDGFNQPGVEAYKRIMGPSLAKVKAGK